MDSSQANENQPSLTKFLPFPMRKNNTDETIIDMTSIPKRAMRELAIGM